MRVYEKLKKEVADRFANDKEIKAALREGFIHWRTPMVGIQDVLLKTPPSSLVQTAIGMREMDNKDYGAKLRKWEAGFIGGSEKLRPNHKGKDWFPPEGSGLFKFYRTENPFGQSEGYEFFLLRCRNKNHFLVKRFGEHHNDLRVLGVGENELYFGNALQNALLWEPKEKVDKTPGRAYA